MYYSVIWTSTVPTYRPLTYVVSCNSTVLTYRPLSYCHVIVLGLSIYLLSLT